METAVMIGVLVAAGLLMASGVWVGLVLTGVVMRIKRPSVTPTREGPTGPAMSRSDAGRP
jgi:hypothetical protein